MQVELENESMALLMRSISSETESANIKREEHTCDELRQGEGQYYILTLC